MELYLKQRTFSTLLFAFWRSRFNFEHFQKKMTVVANVFLNLRTPKKMVI